MAPLKSLERDHPTIFDSDFQIFCATRGIFTVEDFLIHDLNALVAYAALQPSSEKLMQGIDLIHRIIHGMAQPWLNGVDLLNDALQNKHLLSTGIERIDMVLQGGLREGCLIELVGPSSSGKTQVCLQAAAVTASQHAGGVVFLDTGNSFSPGRIADFISQSFQRSCSMEGKLKSLDKAMGNISCARIFDIFSLLDVLRQLESKLKIEMEAESCSTRLLVVDSVSSLITPILGGNGPNGHALMVSVGVLLKKLAYEYSLCVLVRTGIDELFV
ncbi:hypothetical protein Dimus_009072 [Dionaea muscipula]